MKKMMTFLLVAVLLLVAACGKDASEDRLKVMSSSNIVSFDSAQVTDSASLEAIANCIDGLLQLDSEGNVIPAIAESFEVSPDGKTYTFHLRDAKWSNGEAVTAGDFVFAWRRQCKEGDEYSYMLGSTVACVKNADAVIKGADPAILGVSAPDARTLVVELDVPVSFFPSLMTFPVFYPINESFYNSLPAGTYGTSQETMLSNGAFVLSEYLPGAANIQFRKNDSYWDAGRVSLKELQYQVVSSSDNALTAFKNRTLNVVQISGNQVEHARQDANLSKNLSIIPSGSLNYLSFNQDSKNHHEGALANANLRLAISNAIDRESLVDNYIMNGSQATYTAVPIKFAPNAKTGEFFAENQKRYADCVGFDPERARAYLEKAKKEIGKDSFTINFIFSNDSGDTVVKVCQAIKSQVEENLPGVTLNLQPMPKAEYLSHVTSNSFDLAMMNWVPDYNDPMTFLNQWTTTGSGITEHWSNASYDQIIESCTSGAMAVDYDARWKAMHDAERILLEQAVIAPLYSNANAVLISEHVSGIDFHAAGVDRVYKSVTMK